MNDRDLFISHSHVDAATAATLAEDFEKRGITCWFAPRDIPMGSTYQIEIIRAIERCRAMLLLFSGSADKSEHILREVELAAEGNKPIYPLRIDHAMPTGGLKYMLANRHWVERQALGDRLVETIGQLLGTAASPAAETPPPPVSVTISVQKSGAARPAIVAGVVVAVACLAAAGAWFFLYGRPPASQETKTATHVEAPVSKEIPPPPKEAPPPKERAEPGPQPVPVTPPKILASAPADATTLGPGPHLFRECDHCPVMAVIPAAHAFIGSPTSELNHDASEEPQQEIVFRDPFAAGRSEVSFDEWLACVAEGGCNAYRPGDYGWGRDRKPVILVSWNDAKAYVEWLSRKTGARYRLLSEAEWEYAARGCASKACSQMAFWFGDDITPDRANYDWRFSYGGSPKAQALRHTVAVDAGDANPFGLLNVHGNVSEWVEDCWNKSLAGLPADGGARTTGDCNSRVLRGGSWADEPKDVRSARRSWEVVGERRAQIGFRVARSLTRQAKGQ